MFARLLSHEFMLFGSLAHGSMLIVLHGLIMVSSIMLVGRPLFYVCICAKSCLHLLVCMDEFGGK